MAWVVFVVLETDVEATNTNLSKIALMWCVCIDVDAVVTGWLLTNMIRWIFFQASAAYARVFPDLSAVEALSFLTELADFDIDARY